MHSGVWSLMHRMFTAVLHRCVGKLKQLNWQLNNCFILIDILTRLVNARTMSKLRRVLFVYLSSIASVLYLLTGGWVKVAWTSFLPLFHCALHHPAVFITAWWFVVKPWLSCVLISSNKVGQPRHGLPPS